MLPTQKKTANARVHDYEYNNNDSNNNNNNNKTFTKKPNPHATNMVHASMSFARSTQLCTNPSFRPQHPSQHRQLPRNHLKRTQHEIRFSFRSRAAQERAEYNGAAKNTYH